MQIGHRLIFGLIFGVLGFWLAICGFLMFEKQGFGGFFSLNLYLDAFQVFSCKMCRFLYFLKLELCFKLFLLTF